VITNDHVVVKLSVAAPPFFTAAYYFHIAITERLRLTLGRVPPVRVIARGSTGKRSHIASCPQDDGVR
jgi:hypothetical protein